MKIGVISDTHGIPGAWRKVWKLFEGVDLVIHAGDVLYHPPRLSDLGEYNLMELAGLLNNSPVPVIIARGNCDPEVYDEFLDIPAQSPYAVVQFDKTRILVSHGHLISHDGMIDLSKRYHADIFVSGHTHMPVIEDAGSVILLNPGSAAFPKFEKDGRKIPSVGMITEDRIQILSIDDAEVLFEMTR